MSEYKYPYIAKDKAEKALKRLRKTQIDIGEVIGLLITDIERQQRRWQDASTNGRSPYFFRGGRSLYEFITERISEDKELIAELCTDTGRPLPPEYFAPLPPEVEDDYAVNKKKEEE